MVASSVLLKHSSVAGCRKSINSPISAPMAAPVD
jgi:hypothetical protein